MALYLAGAKNGFTISSIVYLTPTGGSYEKMGVQVLVREKFSTIFK